MDDLISRKALLAEYDRVHIGPPGGARKLIEEFPAACHMTNTDANSVRERLIELLRDKLIFDCEDQERKATDRSGRQVWQLCACFL